MLAKLNGQDVPDTVLVTLTTGATDRRFHFRGPASMAPAWEPLVGDQEHVLELYDTSGEVPVLVARAYIKAEHLVMYANDGQVELTGPARGGMDGGGFYA